MTERIEQRYCIKFCQKLGDTQVETIRKIQQAFENEALSPTQIKQWFKRFKDNRASVESDPRSGRPSTSRNEEAMDQVREKVLEDRRLTVREIAAEMGISTGSVHSILTEDLNLRRVSAKFVPKLLTEQQKELRKEISEDMLDVAIMTQNLSRQSSLVMRPGFMVMTQKPSFNHHNGSIRNHHAQKKLGKSAAM